MVNRTWPADAVGGAPQYSGRALRQTQMAPLLGGATAARPFGTRSGVRPGTASTTVTVTSTTWTVRPHAGTVDVQAASEAGPYGYAIDEAVTGAVTAADATNPRRDAIYIQHNDTAEQGGTAAPANVTPVYRAGTVLSGGVLTVASGDVPARSFLLADINMPAVGGGNPTVTWRAPYSAAAGGVIPLRDAADEASVQLPGFGSALGFREDLGVMRRGTSAGGWQTIAAPILHAEFTTQANGIPGGLQQPSGAPYNVGDVSFDAASSTDATFATAVGAGANGQVTLATPGIYAIHHYATSSQTLSGRYYLALRVNGGEVARMAGNGAGSDGEDRLSQTVPNLRVSTAGAVLRFEFYKSAGGVTNLTSRIRITRIG